MAPAGRPASRWISSPVLLFRAFTYHSSLILLPASGCTNPMIAEPERRRAGAVSSEIVKRSAPHALRLRESSTLSLLLTPRAHRAGGPVAAISRRRAPAPRAPHGRPPLREGRTRVPGGEG